MFLDAMNFNENNEVLIGDLLVKKYFLLEQLWSEIYGRKSFKQTDL